MQNTTNYRDRLADVPWSIRAQGEGFTLLFMACTFGSLLLKDDDIRNAWAGIDVLVECKALTTTAAVGGTVVEATQAGRERYAASIVLRDEIGRYYVTLGGRFDSETTYHDDELDARNHAVEFFAAQQGGDPVAAAWGIDSAASN